MIRSVAFIGVFAFFLSSLANAAVINQVTGTSVTPNFTAVTGIAVGEGAPGGTGLSITASGNINDINDDNFPLNTATVTYRVGSYGPSPPNPPTPNPGIASWSFTINNTDPGLLETDLFKDFRIELTNLYAPGVSFTGVTVDPAGFGVTLSTPTRLDFRNNVGVGPGSYTFGFDISIPNPVAPPPGNTFVMRVTARNPEPGSLALAGMTVAMLGGGAFYRRRKRNKKADAPQASE